MSVPEVRDLIARNAVQAKRRMSGEQFLEVCDKALAPIPGVPLAKLAQFTQPFYAKLGVKTGKARSELVASAVGTTIVTLLCAMAKLGYELQRVHQLSDGCILEATLPSDLFSFAGTLVITVRRRTDGTHVEAETNVPGQAFDWGKSARALNALFGEVHTAAAA